MKKIYLVCSLTQAPPEFSAEVDKLRTELKKKYEVLEFIGLEKGTARDVFEWDTECVHLCDLLLAICTYPSIGLGYEMGIAIENKKPVLAVASKDALISRMVLGVTAVNYSFERYEDLLDVAAMVEKKEF